MNGWRSKLLLCLVLWAAAWPSSSHADGSEVRFAALDIHLESANPWPRGSSSCPKPAHG